MYITKHNSLILLTDSAKSVTKILIVGHRYTYHCHSTIKNESMIPTCDYSH